MGPLREHLRDGPATGDRCLPGFGMCVAASLFCTNKCCPEQSVCFVFASALSAHLCTQLSRSRAGLQAAHPLPRFTDTMKPSPSFNIGRRLVAVDRLTTFSWIVDSCFVSPVRHSTRATFRAKRTKLASQPSQKKGVTSQPANSSTECTSRPNEKRRNQPATQHEPAIS